MTVMFTLSFCFCCTATPVDFQLLSRKLMWALLDEATVIALEFIESHQGG